MRPFAKYGQLGTRATASSTLSLELWGRHRGEKQITVCRTAPAKSHVRADTGLGEQGAECKISIWKISACGMGFATQSTGCVYPEGSRESLDELTGQSPSCFAVNALIAFDAAFILLGNE